MTNIEDFLPGEHNGFCLDVGKLTAWSLNSPEGPDGLTAAQFVEFVENEVSGTGVRLTSTENLTAYFRRLVENADEVRGDIAGYVDWDRYADDMADGCEEITYYGDGEDTTFEGDWIVVKQH